MLEELNAGLEAKGVQPDEVATGTEEVVWKAVTEARTCFLKGLKEGLSEMLADRRKTRSSFLRHQHRKWGRPFDLLRMLLEAARESGEEFNKQYSPGAV